MSAYAYYLLGSAGGAALFTLIRSRVLWTVVPHRCNGYVAMAGNAHRCTLCGSLPADYDAARDVHHLTV